MSDLVVLENAVVFDGLGHSPRVGSLVIDGGRIVSVGGDAGFSDIASIDLDGLAVAPGIVDMHTHSDVSALSDPDCTSAVLQGVTTQIVGHCGFSAAPIDPAARPTLVDEEPVFGFPGSHAVTDGPWGWDDIGGYLDTVRAVRPRTNLGTLVGHNSVRRRVMGADRRPPTDVEMKEILRHLHAAFDAGALGVSTGLSYVPGVFADGDELEAVAGVATEHGRRYHTHMRYGDAGIRASLREAIRTAERAGCQVNVSHLYPSPRDAIDEAGTVLGMIDASDGVTFDLTLFRRGGGAWAQSLPAWVRDGGAVATTDRLRDPATRARIVSALADGGDWDDMLIVKVNRPGASGVVGRSIGEIADERGVAPVEAALDLLAEDHQFWVAPTIKRQADLDTLLRHPDCVPVTDGMSAHPVEHAGLGLMPKTFGTFPLLLGDYVRERRVLSLADAIARITSVAAERVGLRGRGRLVTGAAADLVVFDPATIGYDGTDEAPAVQPSGVRHVMVNGEWAVFDGSITPTRSGEVLT